MARLRIGTGSASEAARFGDAVEAALAPLADAERAVGMAAYMRNRFVYLGIQTPERRAAIKPLVRAFAPVGPAELRAAADVLWAHKEREYQYAAADLLVHWRAVFGVDELEWLLDLARQKSWWDTVDALVKVTGAVVRSAGAKGQKRMDRAVRDEDFWIRRTAMLHQLGWRAGTDTARLFRYAERLAPETEFFIRKAVGWALRDYAWHDWRAVERFLDEARERLSPLTCREASKNLAALKGDSDKRRA